MNILIVRIIFEFNNSLKFYYKYISNSIHIFLAKGTVSLLTRVSYIDQPSNDFKVY